MAYDSPARSPGDQGLFAQSGPDDLDGLDVHDDGGLDDDGLEDDDGARERLFPRTPVARRTLLVSASLAAIGLVALIVAVVLAASHIGPSDRPLEVTPLGLDGKAPAAPGEEPPSAPAQRGKVPDVVGMSFTRASGLIEHAGFRVRANYEQGNLPRDTVISQDPPPGTQLDRRGVVTLAVSAGIVEDPALLPTPTTIGATTTTRRSTATTRKPPATTARPATTATTQPPPTEPPPTEPPPTDPPAG